MASEFILSTDSNSDLPLDFVRENNIECMEMKYTMDDVDLTRSDQPIEDFYKDVRGGKKPITTQANRIDFEEFFVPFLEAGKDILHLAFSSGLSGSYNNGAMVAKELSEKYPDRKIYVVDSLCACFGEGLFAYLVNEKRNEGLDIDELYAYAKDLVPHIIHWVTVDDLMHLHRGGRLSKTAAIAGSVLGIKPIIFVNEEGKLETTGKVRGRKQALKFIVDKMEKSVGNTENSVAYIGHADALEDAEYVAELVKERFGIEDVRIDYIGPVIGTHAGPGTIAFFMVGESRRITE